MKKDTLIKLLSDHNVPAQLYSLDGIASGECYCVVNENGVWKVAYSERGKVSDIQGGLTEDEAYDLIYREFREMYGWSS
jgi:hypothetical protein